MLTGEGQLGVGCYLVVAASVVAASLPGPRALWFGTQMPMKVPSSMAFKGGFCWHDNWKKYVTC